MNTTISFEGSQQEMKSLIEIVTREERRTATNPSICANLVQGALVFVKPGDPGYESAVYEVLLFERRKES